MALSKNSMNKYGNKKVIVDGVVFDSKREAIRYRQLLTLQKAGEISDLKRQVEFLLIPNQYAIEEKYSKSGKRLKDKQILLERKVSYISDFTYLDKDHNLIVEDVKSKVTKTPEFIIKKKLMLFIHKIEVKIVEH